VQGFSKRVFARDGSRCIVTKDPIVCAAHILERKDKDNFPDVDIFSVRNGLTLTQTLETKFDKFMWYIDTESNEVGQFSG
jgi:hypothetical protein